VLFVPINVVVLGDWNFESFEDVVYYCPVPEQLLLLQVVDEERFVPLDVPPGHQEGKSVGIEANQSIDDRPRLLKLSNTVQQCSRHSHISTISISGQANLDSIYFMGFDSTFFFLAHTPRVMVLFLGREEGMGEKLFICFILDLCSFCYCSSSFHFSMLLALCFSYISGIYLCSIIEYWV
jgi:hypothetical protein